MKTLSRFLLIFPLLLSLLMPCARAEGTPALTIEAESAVLMEKETGQVLYAQNEHEQLEPASVTKVMTMLLIMEAIDSGVITYDDTVTASAYASSMGGSQIWLKENEQMSVRDMLKAICVVSANDCCVAMAEHLAGSESAFVEKMNQRAKELNMTDTTFVNCNGLPAEGHVTSAMDIAIMSRELMKNHPEIKEFTTIWMDSIRGGEFTLSSTNKLVRFYEGATGLKTGSTDSALYCLSATAERDGMELIATVMKSPTSDKRFEAAKALLNYGFATYTLHTVTPENLLPTIPVTMGRADYVQPILGDDATLLLEKSQTSDLKQLITLEESLNAPVEQHQQIGSITLVSGEKTVAEIPLLASDEVPRLTYGEVVVKMLRFAFLLSPLHEQIT